MELDFGALKKAISSLERSVNVYSSCEGGDDLKEVLRAGVIHNFEFTYEFCWKFMKR